MLFLCLRLLGSPVVGLTLSVPVGRGVGLPGKLNMRDVAQDEI